MSNRRRTLRDIRYFETSTIPAAGVPLFSDVQGQFGLPRDVHRMGQRIACLLEAEEFSIGAASHLYIALTAALAPGTIVPIGAGFDAWQHHVACGFAAGIATRPAREQRRQMEALTFAALRAVAPQSQEGRSQEDILSAVSARIDAGGASTRILRAVKDTAAYRIEVWFDVPDLSGQSHLYVVAHDRRTGAVLDAPPFPLGDHEHVFPLVAGIGVSKGCVNLAPRKSAQADLLVREYPRPLRFPLSGFSVRSATPDPAAGG